LHLILISGNLADHQLNDQAQIYSDIAKVLSKKYGDRFAEGIVAVTAPPKTFDLLHVMKDSGISIVAFNLEAFSPVSFALHCKGKDKVGRDVYFNSLVEAAKVFGTGKAWSNFVLGLEPISDLLEGCELLAKLGITPGANVYHRDHGASLRGDVPEFDLVVRFYKQLATIYDKHEMQPFYCEKALRTSLANEAFDGRFC
jgi:hypothetical protein